MTLMLEQVKLSSFKGFREFTVELSPFTCLVGLNSKGKTSILHAIRLLHDMFVLSFGAKEHPDFTRVNWKSNPTLCLAKLAFDDPSAIWLHRNTTEPCKISVSTTGGLTVALEIRGPNQYEIEVHIEGQSVRGSLDDANTRLLLGEFYSLAPTLVAPVGPVSPSEQLLAFPEMQQRFEQGRLAESWRSYLHWLYNDGKRREFDKVISLIQRYLPETRLFPPHLTHDIPPKVLVHFEEENTTLDISHSGSGMRTLLNLAVVLQFAKTGCLLCDEPDSHLHGSLQRAVAQMLIDFAAEHNSQIIVATHSPDFVAEVPVENLVWIDRNRESAHRANKLGSILADLGTATSADAVRAYGADKVLFVEGSLDRRSLMQLVGPCCDPNPFVDPEVLVASLPNGKGDIQHLNMFSEILRSTFKLEVRIAAIVDNDFEFEQEDAVSSRPRAIRLPRKEIENYFIDPTVFARALEVAAVERGKSIGKAVTKPTQIEVQAELNRLLDLQEHSGPVRWQVMSRYHKELSSELDASTRMRQSDEWFKSKWDDSEWRIRNCTGKKVLASLRKWAQDTYSLTATNDKLCEACRDHFHDELYQTAGSLVEHLYS